MLSTISTRQTFWLIFAVAMATILGAWAFEAAGYLPCELCLKQRLAYYIAIPISLILALMAPKSPSLARNGLIVLGLIMLASAIFGIYHSGVEWKFWAGPTECTGTFGGGLPDLTKKAVMCDQAAIRIFGISLAGYNALISAALSLLAFGKAYGSSSASQ
ncbi:MAG: disulfide bond formation protein B [Alphaproteobacteria bacterium]|nr:disulfide bond formation protein B [Alphaproteobacteria bacterium]